MLLSNPELGLLGKDSQELVQDEQHQDLLFRALLWSRPPMAERPELTRASRVLTLLGSRNAENADRRSLVQGHCLEGKCPAPCGNLLPVSLFEALVLVEYGFVGPQLQPLYSSEKNLATALKLKLLLPSWEATFRQGSLSRT